MSSSFNNKNQLLEKLMEFHLEGLSQYIDLPRVVLLGSSDSAKQTVIMALTGLPLPVDYLGIDFTMEFVLLPSERTSIKMSVVPACARDPDTKFQILALKDEISGEDSDGEGLFEFLFGRMIAELRAMGEPSFSVEDVLRLEIRRPFPGPMAILDLPQYPCRKSTHSNHSWSDGQLRKHRNANAFAHDNLSTLKLLRMDPLRRYCNIDRSRDVFVARAACLTTHDAVQLRALVQKRFRRHRSFAFGWFVLEDMEYNASRVQRPYTLDGFDFRCKHPETDDVHRGYQSLGFFNHLKSELEEMTNASRIIVEVERVLHVIREERRINGRKGPFHERLCRNKKIDFLEAVLEVVKGFDQEDTTRPSSSASSTIERKLPPNLRYVISAWEREPRITCQLTYQPIAIHTPTESLADGTEVHGADNRTSTPTPNCRAKNDW